MRAAGASPWARPARAAGSRATVGEDLHERRQVGEVPDYPAVFLSDGQLMVTLWQAEDPERARPFDRKRGIGLHHLALAVENEASLKQLSERLARAPGVTVEFAAEPLGGGPAQHMMCAIPGGIRLEFIAPAA